MVAGITDLMDMSLSKFWDIVKEKEGWHAAVHGVTKSRTRLSDWTTNDLRSPVPESRQRSNMYFSL